LSDPSLHSALSTALAGLLVVYGLLFAVRRLRRVHPGLAIGLPVAIGFAARLLAVAAVDGSGLSSALRGGDETTFTDNAIGLAAQGWSSPQWVTNVTNDLHVAVFAGQIKLLDFPPTALRMVQIGIAMAGLLLLVAAVHDLVGPRAAVIITWVLMLEPAGIFFDSALHKEPLMLLASGICVYGATRLWSRFALSAIAISAVGGAIAVMTRGYAGWFLVSAMVLLVLHASLRRLDRPLRALPLIYAVLLVGFLVAPALLQVSSKQSLKTLQASQNANADQEARVNSSTANANNLALERVDYSTRGKVASNLPKRIADVVLKPYPWQLSNASQALGAIGSMVALIGLGLLLRYAWLSRGRLLALTAPILYPLTFLLMAYALSAGNAGTSFRYRTHIVTLSLAMLVILRDHVLSRRPSPVVAVRRPIPDPAVRVVTAAPGQLSAWDPAHTPVESWTAEPTASGRKPRIHRRILRRWKLLLLAVAVVAARRDRQRRRPS